MPKTNCDYSKTVIYKIVCNDLSITDCYLGHITNFTKRKGQHKSICNLNSNKDYNIEDKLLDDFDTLTDLYDKRYKCDRKIDRKNFINTQYVLYQFLNRHKFPCKKEDFNILKTIDRKSFHDDICIGLFAELGWNFSHTFYYYKIM